MTTYKKQLKDKDGNVIYPDVGIDLDKAVYSDNPEVVTPEPWVNTTEIVDEAVTSAKIDWSTMRGVLCQPVYLGTKNLSNASQNIDIRYYFCDKVSGENAAVVYDEILFVVHGTWSETTAVHYLRFGGSSEDNRTSRNSLSFVPGGSEVTFETGDFPNIAISSRVAISEKITVLPFFGDSAPSVASDLNSFTISNMGNPALGLGGSKLHFGSLYRSTLNGTYSGIDMYADETATISGTLKIYGIKYPTT